MHAPLTSPRERVVCRSEDRNCDALDAQLAKSWLRIGVAAVFAGQAMVFSLAVNTTPPAYGSAVYWIIHGLLLLSSVAVMAFIGGPLFRSTLSMLRSRVLSIEGLFTLSLCGAFAGSVYSTLSGRGAVYYEVVGVVLAVYTVGRMLGERSMAKVMQESAQLRERFDHAVLFEDGQRIRLPVAELTVGAVVEVTPGASFTVDGVVVDGVGYVRETALTGEPMPVVKRRGDSVRAGTWSLDGSFHVEATRLTGAREIDAILDAVERNPGRPSRLQVQANELMRGFLPLVVGVSIATAIYWTFVEGWSAAVLNSMSVLLVACPCALGLATPVAIWHGLYRLAGIGLVSRNGDLIDALARTRHVFFDKTGTLSEGDLKLMDLVADDAAPLTRAGLVDLLATVQSRFDHPIARAFVNAREGYRDGDTDALEVRAVRLVPGKGVAAEARIGGVWREFRMGEGDWMPDAGSLRIDGLTQRLLSPGKRIFAALDGQSVAVAALAENLRAKVGDLFAELSQLGIRATVLTGDPNPQVALPGTVELVSGLSAADKEARVRDAFARGEHPVFVGDGINDARAMAAASASIAVSEGAGLVRTAACGQLTGNNPAILAEPIRWCRRMHQHLKGNLIFAASYNVLGMSLAACGLLHPVLAALIMVGSSVIVTTRALTSSGPDRRREAINRANEIE